MAGSLNNPSVIWVAGEVSGKNEVGATVVVSGYLPESSSDLEAYADNAVDVLHDRLVASGILES